MKLTKNDWVSLYKKKICSMTLEHFFILYDNRFPEVVTTIQLKSISVSFEVFFSIDLFQEDIVY